MYIISKSKKQRFSIIMLIMFFCQIISPTIGEKAFAADVNNKTIDNALKIEIVTDKSTISPSENAITKVKYSFAATDSNGINLKIEYKIPKNMNFVKVNKSPDVKKVENKNLSDGTELVTVYFNDEILPGVSGMFEVYSKFDLKMLDKKATGLQEATLTGFKNNGQEYTAAKDKITYNTETKKPDWSIEKIKEYPSGTPVLDSVVSYRIKVNGNSNGGPYIENAEVCDILPKGAVFVSATDNGVYKDGKITWNLPSLSPNSNKVYFVKVIYPKDEFKDIDKVTNKVEATVSMYKDNPITETKAAETSHGFGDPEKTVSKIVKNTRRDNDEYSIGQEVEYYVSGFTNTGNVPLNKYIIIDDIPKELDLTKVSTGKYYKDINIAISYKTNKSTDYIEWKTVKNPNDEFLNVEELRKSGKLKNDEYITNVKWDYGNSVPPAFCLQSGNSLYVGGKILSKDRDGKDIKPGDKITNTATHIWDKGSNTDSETVSIDAEKPWLESKISVDKTEVGYEDDITYSLLVKNNKYAKGNMVAPIVSFIVPKELALDPSKLSFEIDPKNSGYDAKTLNDNVSYTYKEVKINGETKSVLNWNFNDSIILYPDKHFYVKFKSKIKDKALTGTFNNEYFLSQKDTSNLEEMKELILDKDNLTGDVNRKLLHSDVNIFIKFQGSIKADEWSLGELDDKWNRYKGSKEDNNIPTDQKGISLTTPGGIVNYLIRIDTSDVNGPLSDLVLIDELPYKNDVGVIDGQPRGSVWRPYMVGGIEIGKENGSGIEIINDKNIKIYYTTNEKPSKTEINDPLANEQGSDWSEKLPEDITTVKGIKIDFGKYKVEPETKIYIHWAMKAPLGAPLGKVAWNSFAYNAAVSSNNEKGLMGLLPSEPLKIGFQVDESKKGNLGNFIFEDLNANGVLDDNEVKKGINGLGINLIGSTKKIDTGSSPFSEMVGDTKTGDNQDDIPGYYLFPDLEDGTYKVKFNVPSEYYISKPGVTSDPNKKSTDVDIVVNNDIKEATTKERIISGGNNITDANLGIYKKAVIEDIVYNDENLDNKKNNGELGIEGVIVSLTNRDGSLVKDLNGKDVMEVTTDKDGKYTFDYLKPGDYTISYKLPKKLDQFLFTSNIKDSNEKLDVTVTSGQKLNDLNVGIHEALVGGRIWEDWNFNGLQDSGEIGINDVTIKIYQSLDGTNKNGKFIGEKKTDSEGKYLFGNLDSGEYYIEVSKPNNYDKFTKQVTGDGSSKVDSTGLSEVIKIGVGQEERKSDVGITVESKIGSYIYEDINGNESKDKNEPYYEGAKIELLDKDKNPIVNKSEISDKNGEYEFVELHKGEYYLKVTPKLDSKLSIEETGLINLGRQEVNHNVNVGLTEPVIIEGNVWNDVNWDKKRDSEDYNIENIEVTFFRNGSKIPTATINTDKNGNYKISTLKPGKYIVKFTDKGNNYVPNDKDVIELEVMSGEIKNNQNLSMHKAKISDKIWYDIDCNGKLDNGEEVLKDVTVKLLDKDLNVLKEVKTDGSGIFNFYDLNPGEYIVNVTKPEGYDRFTNGSKYLENGNTEKFNLAKGEDKTDIGCPLVAKSNIGDLVFEDLNGNGIKDSNEKGIENVEVKLLDKDKKEVSTIKTDKDGSYKFNDLREGKYFVQVVKPSEYMWFSPNNTDSKVDEDGLSSEINLLKDKDEVGLDAGLIKESIIKGNVYDDFNWNNSKEKDEKNINDEMIELYINDKIYGTEKTNKDGNYEFKNLKPGSYEVRFIDESGNYIPTDSSKATVKMTLISGDSKEANLGIHKGKIVNKVWYDINCNGKLDNGEEALKDVTVKLLDKDSKVLKEVKTDGSGSFIFDDLNPGEYIVNVTKPEGYDRFTEGSKYLENGNTEKFNLVKGEEKTDIGCPLVAKSNIGDLVFEDLNGNGIKDSNEKGIENVEVKLLDKDKKEVLTTKTDKDGSYKFNDLREGKYFVQVVKPSEYMWFSQNNTDSKVDEDGLSAEVNLAKDKCELALDAGLVKESTIRGNVWNDIDWKDKKESPERNINGEKVELYLQNKLYETKKTNEDGNYEFKNLKPGSYEVKFIDETGNYIPTESSKATVKMTLISGDSKEANLGIHKGKIVNKVWYDINCNGKLDNGEEVLKDVTVKLLDKDSKVLKEVKIDEGGSFIFDDLNPGKYIVNVTKPEGYDRFTNGSKYLVNGNTEKFNLAKGEEKTDIGCPLVAKSNIGDLVFEDLNGDGIKDSNEKGIENVEVKLLDKDKKEVSTIKTDKDGSYKFNDLREGRYFVQVVKPSEYMWFSPNNTDSKVDEDGLSSEINLLKDKDEVGLDAGLIKAASIKDIVYNDKNFNKEKDSGELGIPNLKVELYKKEDDKEVKVSETKTDKKGGYNFRGLHPGFFFVRISNPNDTVYTQRNEAVTLKSGEEDTKIPNSLKYYNKFKMNIFEDLNYNGKKDKGEKAIKNATIKILDPNGNRVKDIYGNYIPDMVTDENGDVVFSYLPNGKYRTNTKYPKEYAAFSKEKDGVDSGIIDLNGKKEEVVVDNGAVKYSEIKGGLSKDYNNGKLEGISVKLYDKNNKLIEETKTDAKGNYKLEKLIPNEYYIVINNDMKNAKKINLEFGETESIKIEKDNSISKVESIKKDNNEVPNTGRDNSVIIFIGFISIIFGLWLCNIKKRK